jgi:hypothetical protein
MKFYLALLWVAKLHEAIAGTPAGSQASWGLYLVLLWVAKLHEAGHNVEEMGPGLFQLRGPESLFPHQGTDSLGQYLKRENCNNYDDS